MRSCFGHTQIGYVSINFGLLIDTSTLSELSNTWLTLTHSNTYTHMQNVCLKAQATFHLRSNES